MWKIYNKTPRKFKVTAENLLCIHDERIANEYNLNAVIQELYDEYEDNNSVEIKVYEILNIEWEEEDEKLH